MDPWFAPLAANTEMAEYQVPHRPTDYGVVVVVEEEDNVGEVL